MVTIPSDLVSRLSYFLGQTRTCRGHQQNRRDLIDPQFLLGSTEAFITTAMPGEIFENLFFVQGAMYRIGNTARVEYIRFLNNANFFAHDFTSKSNVNKKAALSVALIGFALVYEKIVVGDKLTENNIFQASEIETSTGFLDSLHSITSPPSPASTISGFPGGTTSIDPENVPCCQDKNCQGESSIQTCEKVCARKA